MYQNDPVCEFKDFALSNGIVIHDQIIADGQIHRFKIDGKNNGAYVLHHDDFPAGYVQDFKTGIKLKWKANAQRKVFSDTERQAYKLRAIEGQKQRQANELFNQQQAAQRAVSIWKSSKPATSNHPYLVKKQVSTLNLRQYKDSLIVPIYNHDRELVNLQFIYPDGKKRFLEDARKKGCFSVVGKRSTGSIAICEGWSTGKSVYENFKYQTVIALDAGNLELVARVWRDLFPAREIVIFGDNDKSMVGQKAAEAAAKAVNGTWIVPPIEGMDWNDYCNSGAFYE